MADHRADSAVVFPVYALYAALDAVTGLRPAAVRRDSPPHISVAYPFLPAARIDDDVRDRLGGLVAARPAVTVTLGAPRAAPGILYASPEPSAPVDMLVDDVERTWPAVREARAAHYADKASIGAHLTLALGADSEAGAHDELADALTPFLPATITLDRVWLLLRDGPDGGWRLDRAYDVGPPGERRV